MDDTLLRLKEVRELFKKSQAGFAKMLDIPQPTYLRYESGVQKFSSKLIESLILKFNLNINWLFTGEGSMFVKNHSGKLQKPPRANLYCINEKIKFLIKKNKINKTMFTNIVKLEKDRVNAILKNKSLPTVEELFKISENFDISFDWLFKDDEMI